MEQRYKRKTGISLGNNVAKYLDYNRKNTGDKLPKAMTVPVNKTGKSRPDPASWIVFPSIEIEYIRNEAMSIRLKQLSKKNSIENNGFVDEIKHFDEKKSMAESQYMPYFNVNIPTPHNMDSSMPVPVVEALKQKQTKVVRSNEDVAKPPKKPIDNAIEVIDDEGFEKRSIHQSGKWNEGSGESFNIRGGNLQSFVRSKSYPSLRSSSGVEPKLKKTNLKTKLANYEGSISDGSNSYITTPITPLARSISSNGLNLLREESTKILQEIVDAIQNNINRRVEDLKYERRFGKKRAGAMANDFNNTNEALNALSRTFVKKYSNDPYFEVEWARVAGETEDEWKQRLEGILATKINSVLSNNMDWPLSTAGTASSGTRRAATGGILLTPGLNTASRRSRRVTWADSDRAPPSPYVHARTKSRSSNFRMITSRSMKFRPEKTVIIPEGETVRK